MEEKIKRIPIILDTDPGVDDFFCMAIALAYSDVFDLKGITTIGGNNATAITTRNALAILNLFNRNEVPVAYGEDSFLLRPFEKAVVKFHGENGLGNVEIEDSKCKQIDIKASEFIYKTALSLGKELVLVTVGPQTNVGRCLLDHSDLKDHIKKIVVMGGGINTGNATKYAEANIHHDAYASQLILDANIPVEMIGLNATRQAPLPRSVFDKMSINLNPKIRKIMQDLIDFRNGEPMHDALAIATMIDRNCVNFKKTNINVIQNGEREGETVFDFDENGLHYIAESTNLDNYYQVLQGMVDRIKI